MSAGIVTGLVTVISGRTGRRRRLNAEDGGNDGSAAMIGIGEFARLGRVSLRMLRHYDAIGLLPPARVDPVTGYRAYTLAQLARLNRIVVFKDLGFSLQQVAALLDEALPVAELRGMLRLRQAELAASIAEDQARLERIAARLATIAAEGQTPARGVVVKAIPGLRVVELSQFASGYSPRAIGPVLGPLFTRLAEAAARHRLVGTGPALAYYEGALTGVVVHAAFPVAATAALDAAILTPVVVRDLPAVTAATTIHQGSIASAATVVQSLAAWIGAHGYQGSGFAREVYHACGADPAAWVTEFQEPIRPLAPERSDHRRPPGATLNRIAN